MVFPTFTWFKDSGEGPLFVSYGTNDATAATDLLTTDVQNPVEGEAPAFFVVLEMTGTLAAGAIASLPSVASLISLFNLQGNGGTFGYVLRVINSSSADFAWTIDAGGDANWTLVGTMTIAQNTTRDFLIELDTQGMTGALISVGTGTNS